MADAFKRRQVNGYGAGTVKAGSLQTLQPKGTILQCMLMDDFPQIVKDAKSIDGSILFDPSGGRGVFVSGWPMPPYEVPVGLAGGIGPDNIADLLRQWTNPGPDAWIDLESKARDENDRFDLGKVRETLEEAKRSGWPSES